MAPAASIAAPAWPARSRRDCRPCPGLYPSPEDADAGPVLRPASLSSSREGPRALLPLERALAGGDQVAHLVAPLAADLLVELVAALIAHRESSLAAGLG